MVPSGLSIPAMARTDATRRAELAELRERVAELERERELLNAIANTAPSLLCLIDPDGTVARRRRTGRSSGASTRARENQRRAVLGAVRPDRGRGEVRAAIEAVVAGGEPTFHEGRWLTQAGEVVHVEWSCSPLPMISSGPLYLLSAADVTERKRHEAEVRDSRARIVAAVRGTEAARAESPRRGPAAARRRVARAPPRARARGTGARCDQALDAAIAELRRRGDELRELARGIHPAALTERGLATAVGASRTGHPCRSSST